jgi:predicted ATP-grasp superfamily ATP-dependent carboligase
MALYRSGIAFNPRFQGTYFVRQIAKTAKKGMFSLSIPVFRGLTLLVKSKIKLFPIMFIFQSPFSGDLLC